MSTPIDLTALKERQKVAWASGDYAVIGTTLQIVGENLAEACDLRCDEEVLDVAAGNGNATLAAARRGCLVTSTDYVAALLERGQDRARAEHLDVTFQVADAEALPFADDSFDAVLSTFGVMFAPGSGQGRRRTGAGLSSGRSDRSGQLDAGRFCRPDVQDPRPPSATAAGAQPPSNWGTEAWLHTHFDDRDFLRASDPAHLQFPLSLGAHFIDIFRHWYGPVHKAFAALPPESGQALESDLADLLNRSNRAGEASLVVPSEYLEVVITKR